MSAAQERVPQFLVTLDDVESDDVYEAARQWRESAERRADDLRRGWAQEARSSAQRDQRLTRLVDLLVRVQISQMVRRSACRLLQVLDTRPHVIVVNAEMNSTEPSESDLCCAFESFVTAICRCCHGMLVEDDLNYETQTKAQLSRILERYLSAPRVHLAVLHTRFEPLTSEATLVEDDFEALRARVAFLQHCLSTVLEEPPEEVSDLIVLRKEGLLEELERIAKGAIQSVVSRMERLHQRDALGICRAFREIAARASAAPASTAELMAAQDFLSVAQRDTIGELEGRIARLTARMAQLMRLRFLSTEHCALNTEALRWLSEIGPCFVQSEVFFEQQRTDFERLLQQRTDQLNRKLEEAMPRLALVNDMRLLERVDTYLEETRKLRRRLLEFEEEADWINSEEALFRFPLSTYPELDELKNCLLPVWGLLCLCRSWRTTLYKWMDGAFDELDAESIQDTTNKMLQKTEETQQQFRVMIKQQIADNNPRRLKGTLDDPGNLPAPLQLCQQLLEDIKQFKSQLVLVRVICNRCLFQRHWVEISTLLKVEVCPDAGASLRKMLKLPFTPELLQKCEVISFGATKELALQDELAQMQDEWEKVNFRLFSDPERGCSLLTDLDDLQALLASAILRTQAMRGSAFAKPHAVELRAWYAKLSRAAATLTTWALVQEQWRHLSPIFKCCDDAARFMPTEAQLFALVDATVRDLAHRADSDPCVMHLAGGPVALKELTECAERLNAVNQAVVRYLGVKRRAFPRFFFLSNEELLSVLSAAPHLDRVAALCIFKIFEAAKGAEFDEEERLICLTGQETLEVEPVPPGPVEQWFAAVEVAIAEAMKRKFDEIHWKKRKTLEGLLQLVLVAAAASWTKDVESSMRWPKKMEYVEILNGEMKEEISSEERKKVSYLLMTNLHYLEVVQKLRQDSISKASDFQWLSQIRFYYDKEKNLEGRLMFSNYQYGWEFLSGPYLVLTPPTLRCYRALVAAHQMGAFLNLQGPACSGKSCTFLGLAAQFGRFKISITCSVATNELTLLRVLQGSAGCGAWCLLDEVHQLTAEVLSVTAQHVLDLSMACEADAPQLCLQGRQPVPLARPSCLLCVTSQQPLRAQVPNNFKSLFRPWTLREPDVCSLVEIKLRAAAIENAKENAVWLTTALKVAQQRLGVRENFGVQAAMQAVSLLISENIPLHLALGKILLPGVSAEERPILQSVLKDTFLSQIDFREADLQQSLLNSKGLIVTGPPGSGKTTAIKKAAGENQIELICPLALDFERLFGHLNKGEWHDGVVTSAIRTGTKWLLFDGPLEPWWVENLQSAMDDPAKLNLASGEALYVRSNVKIIFETQDLRQASPGLLGRCQCVFFGEISWKVVVDTWLENSKEELWAKQEGTLVKEILNWIVPPCVEFTDQFKPIISPSGLVDTLISIFAMYLKEPCQDPEAAKHVRAWLQAALMLSGAWAFSGPLLKPQRELFDEFYKNLWRGNQRLSTDYPVPACMEGKVDVAVPGEGVLLDHSFVFRFKGSWKYWPDILRAMKLDDQAEMFKTVIPTIDTERLSHLMQLHVQHGRPLMLRGPKDSGKSCLLHHFALERLNSSQNQAILVRLTHGADAPLLQSELSTNLSRSSHGLGPAAGCKRCVILVDDVGTAHSLGPQELLRQVVDHSTLHESATSVKLNHVLTLGALDETREVTPRLLRHFSVLCVGPMSEESASRIFGSLMGATLKRNGFASDVAAFVTAAVQSTLDVVHGSASLLRPWRPHYAVGTAEAQRIILGCSQILKEDADNKRALVRLWCHEVQRSVGDRLSASEERQILQSLVEAAVKDNFKEQPGLAVEQKLFGRLLTGRYIESDRSKFEARASKCVEGLGEDIVLFPEAVDLLARVCRLLQMPQGNALLLGPSGRGRRTLSRLASHMVGYELIQPKAGFESWRNLLKAAMRRSGADDKDTVLLVGEEVLAEERFLEGAHCVLSAGDVPGLFSTEERQEIMETVMLDAQGGQRTVDLVPLQVFEFFACRCRKRLHWMICLDPSDKRFRTRLQRYPALLTQCTPVWFTEWPEEALERISQRHLKEQSPAAVVAVCRRLHQAARRYVQVNAANFAELLQLLDSVTAERKERILDDRQRYLTGLEKLQLAAEQVQRIQEELCGLQPRLAEAAAETREMLAVIETETRKVSEASLLVRSDEAVANSQAAAAQELKSECETELAQAIPILEDAVAALNTLKPSDITLVKSMKNPPEPIKLVMAAVCVIRNIKPDRLNDASTGRKILDYWGPSKKLLGDIAFLQQLKDFDKDNIPPSVMAKIRKDFIPHPDFRPEVVTNASSAAEGLCKWVRAMDMYDAVAKEVAPKKAKLEIAQQEYAATLAVLEEKRAQVRRLEKQLAELRSQFDAANSHKLTLESEFQACERKLARAEKLIGGLSGERQRWASTASSLDDSLKCLEGDALLGSATATYLGPLKAKRRASCIGEWLALLAEEGVASSADLDVTLVLSSEMEIEAWHIGGLQRDAASTQSAVIARHALRPCVCRDPQRQANAWIKSTETRLRVSQDWDEELVTRCKEDGVPLLVEDVEEPDVLLEALLAVPLRSNNSGFRVYITTRSSVSRELLGCITLVEFALPAEGLEEQLLGLVMAAEQPALRLARQQVVREGAANKAALQATEERILSTLSASQGNLLEDEAAVDVLDTSRAVSLELAQRQQEAQKTLGQITDFKAKHRALARDSAAAYATLNWLPTLGSTYHFSHAWFLQLFSSSVRNSCKMGLGDELTSEFLKTLCEQVCAALFRRHHLAFLLRLSLDLLRARKEITLEDIAFLYDGGIQKDESKLLAIPRYSEIKEKWSEWKFFEEEQGKKNKLLKETWGEISCYDRLVLSSIFFPKLQPQTAEELVKQTLQFDCRFKAGSLESAFENSSSQTPIFCALGPAVDISRALIAFSRKEITEVAIISMASGQTGHAEAAIANAMATGNWVCLSNCHLTDKWLRKLERMTFEKASPNFRLWLTCCPEAKLPIGLVQSSVKAALEEPLTLREAMKEALQRQETLMESCNGREAPYCRLVFGLSFFFALLQGRTLTKAITLGEADLNLASKHLWELCWNTRRVPMKAAIPLVGDCGLLGHISDPWDLRVAATLLKECINESLLTATANYELTKVGHSSLFPPQIPTIEACLDRVSRMPWVAPIDWLGVTRSTNHELFGPKIQTGATLEEIFHLESFSHKLEEMESSLPSLEVSKEQGEVNTVAQALKWEEVKTLVRLEEARKCLKIMKQAMTDGFVPNNMIEDVNLVARGAAPKSWMPAPEVDATLGDFENVNANLPTLVWPQNKHVWMPGMERPEALFASVMQLECRSRGVSLSDVSLELRIDPGKSPCVVTARGFWLDGADYDIERACLVEQVGGPKELPAVSICATTNLQVEGKFQCPIYSDEEKRHSIGSIWLSGGDAKIWTKRGVVIFLKRRT
ncbi:dynein axonemal heavy chain 3-like [Neocloeon triangulifer]|uniref:dynein axonemal heavy chain 3-like n=1 Tax=Neocloeon triangulifer TaxID=2078957 RepID=UPI00286F3130|nr:dynein axonemal heavy chain 3-like [Neocloeon triangulifer]